ncbi:putative disease resistance protein RGA3 [Lactuca sativa]|uniref:Uncharacterized protein n=1 Tax=Lactuca sativa TaxID=4236 RepID=A0A9R1WFD4_LACSA|nr:putative disease resistance protein RGA3 [Lactuca sativa]XP_023728237.1 putative disease resistance protein RGA3 [Lactuca sativa]KAJ0222853.1 hypothetical protein LSAT_V11C200060490 [Lactuca sativa]
MAEGLVTIAAEGILKKILSIAAGELAIAWGYEEKLIGLHRTLDLIRAKLLDAEGKKETRAVMVWLKQLKDVVGEADDVLDEVHYEMLRRQINKEDQVERKVPCLPSLKRFSFRNEIGHKIEKINKTLLLIDTRANSLGLQGEHSAAPVPDRLYWRETVPHPEEFKIVGRVEDEEHIIHLLTESRKEEKLTIVPITGMGGMGKTTLAKSVYNNPKIQQRFDVKAWLCVSVKVDINTLLAKIYECFSGRKSMSDLKVNLIKSLEEELATKRYLLVLDDVWVEERQYWEDFRSCMIKVNSRNGSGILVTTRKLDIGTTGMKVDSCLLKGLSDDHCWDIFRERAFVAGTMPSRELEEIGREIVNKCGGLPLLLNLIGGMLANYNDKEKWLAIRNSKVWDLEDETERVQKSLELSFDNLPNSMAKRCFAYCSIFKKDKVMKREELVLLWMALGLVQAHEERNKEMEDVGNDIFQILNNNSLFQDVERDEYGKTTRCSMHDLVHDLSLSLSNHESLNLMDATNDDIACMPQVRHLAFYQEKNNDDEFEGNVSLMFIERNLVARNLHTLFIKCGVKNKFPFQRLKCVRILKLKGCRIWMIDDSIGELVHLRYLDLSNTRIHVLPKSIGKLYHLQTLKLLDCLHLEFPEEMRNLISLRHYESHQSLPANFVGHLTSLRTLMPYFRVLRNEGHGIEELSRLKHLRGKLCIFNLENVRIKEDAVKADLCSKKSLYEIEFSWSENHESASRNDREVLEGLQLPGDVKILQIQNFSSDSFPEWVMKMGIYVDGKWMLLNKLVQIKLIGCRSCLSLPMLENLPHLRDLVLEDMDSLTCLKNSNVTGSTKPLSPSLISLRLERMKKLEKWIDGAPNSSKMISPVLQILNINGCPKITLIDECHPHPLVSLKIRDCTGLVSIKSIHGLTSLESLSIEKCPNLLGIAPFFGDNYPTSVTKMAMDIEGKWIPFDKLISITLIGCTSCLSLPALEHLPHLRDLELWLMDKLTCLRSSDVTGSTKPLSPSLRSLQLRGMKRLEKWIDGAPNSSTMISPVLERLDIDLCPEIIVLDECHPHPLVSLKISHCTGLVSIKNIQRLTSLVSLSIENCPSLLEIDDLSNQCHSLKTVKTDICHKLQSFRNRRFVQPVSNSSFSLPMEIIEELPLPETELDSS